jgi:hypothetical protein
MWKHYMSYPQGFDNDEIDIFCCLEWLPCGKLCCEHYIDGVESKNDKSKLIF